MRGSGATAAALVLVLAATAGGPWARATAAPEGGEETQGRLLLLLDASGSMAEPAAGGGTKIEAAREALTEVVDRLPDDAEVGMRVFGATVFSAEDEGACTDTQNVVPVGPLDRAALTEQISAYEPYGETPIGAALRAAAADLGDTGKRTVVLLSDGEPTCRPDPCVVARQLRAKGVGLRVNVVGLDVDPAARRALQCIAAAGGGSYVDVRDPVALSDSLVRVSVRALREFAVQGTPVEGGPTPEAAPEVEPGQYVDRLRRGETLRYYEVPKQPGGGLAVSVTTRPESSGSSRESMTVRLLSESEEECAEGRAFRVNVLAEQGVLSAGAFYLPGMRERETEECAEAERLLVEVRYDEDAVARSFELLVEEQPAVVSDLATLPEPVDDTAPYEREARASGTPEPVIGGTSFNDAPTLVPGVYADTLRPGEQLFYRVPVDWGQAPRVTFAVQPDVRAEDLLGQPGNSVDALVFNPYRQAVTNLAYGDDRAEDGGFYDGETGLRATAALAPVRLRNGSAPWERLADQSVAGDYFVAVRMGSLDDDTEFMAAVRISVEVEGAVDGVPELSEPLASPSPSAEEDGEDGATAAAEPTEARADADESSLWPLLGAGLALLAVGVGVGWLVARRR